MDKEYAIINGVGPLHNNPSIIVLMKQSAYMLKNRQDKLAILNTFCKYFSPVLECIATYDLSNLKSLALHLVFQSKKMWRYILKECQ